MNKSPAYKKGKDGRWKWFDLNARSIWGKMTRKILGTEEIATYYEIADHGGSEVILHIPSHDVQLFLDKKEAVRIGKFLIKRKDRKVTK